MKEFTSSHCLEAVLTLYSSKCLSSCSAQLSSPVLVISRCIKHAPRSPPSHLDLVYLLFTTISTYTPLLFQLEFPSQSLGFQSLTAFSIAFMLSNLYNKRNLPPIFPNNSFHCNLASFNHVLQMSKLDWVRDSVQQGLPTRASCDHSQAVCVKAQATQSCEDGPSVLYLSPWQQSTGHHLGRWGEKPSDREGEI